MQVADPDAQSQHGWTSDLPAWRDVATVTVPAKTKRNTVLAKAFEGDESNAPQPGCSNLYRILPADVAEPIKVEMEQPPPQLKIG